jgi:hypothetical protein
MLTRTWAELDDRPDVMSPAAACLLGSRIRIPLRAWMFDSDMCCVGSGIGLKYTQLCMLFYTGVKLGLALREKHKLRVVETGCWGRHLGLRRK